MSATYNPEADIVAQIEKLELEARQIRRHIDQCRSEDDRRVLNQQLIEIEDQVETLKKRLP